MHSLSMSKIILLWGLTVMWGYACIGLGRNVPEITKGHLCPRQRVDNRIDRIGNTWCNASFPSEGGTVLLLCINVIIDKLLHLTSLL